MNKKCKTNVLIVDDDAFMREHIRGVLLSAGYESTEAGDGKEAIDKLGSKPDLVLLDLNLPQASGLEVLGFARSKHPDIPVIVVSGTGEVLDAVAALKNGATDYIHKPFETEELLARVKEVFRRKTLEQENMDLRSAFAIGPKIELIAQSEQGKNLVHLAERSSQVNSTVLITGPSGTGKSIIARWIHANSDRASAPFVCVSCGALPRDLIESELFGHEKGAYTGADQARAGRFESACGGTLFLDEIGELPLDLQPKLLNVLQDRVITRLGSTHARVFDARVIAATNRDLAVAVDEGTFREDLYYRLNVLRLQVPPLCQRQSDIAPLLEQKLSLITARLGIQRLEIEPDAMDLFLAYDWPGNVRELENVLERAIVFAKDGRIRVADLSQLRRSSTSAFPTNLVGRTLAEIEQQAILQTLESVNGSRSQAALQLGVSERTIYSRLKEYGTLPE